MFTQRVYNETFMIRLVVISPHAQKQLRLVPKHIVTNLMAWVEAVQEKGLETVRQVPGFHDEPLKGQRKGERSIRLSRAYRAIYTLRDGGRIEFASVEEVSKHDY